MLEIRPTIKWNKGQALNFLLKSLGERTPHKYSYLFFIWEISLNSHIIYAIKIGYEDSEDVVPVYIGDDRTDEDAFKV